MCSTSIFPCIITMVPILMIFFIASMCVFKFFSSSIADFCIFISFLLFIFNDLIFSLSNSIISIVCSLKDSKNFSMHSLPLYTSCLFSILFNVDIVGIEKSDGICSPSFVVDEFSTTFQLRVRDSQIANRFQTFTNRFLNIY